MAKKTELGKLMTRKTVLGKGVASFGAVSHFEFRRAVDVDRGGARASSSAEKAKRRKEEDRRKRKKREEAFVKRADSKGRTPGSTVR